MKAACCRKDSGLPRHDNERAGKWGDYNCNSPPWTIQTFFEFAREQIKPDFALWGGDSVPDAISTLTLEGNVAQIKRVTREVMEGLPDTKIFATIGNHDTYP